uniref:Uncharacterized protein n=1 Tax=Setaria digitata TaxID=48799 RepID=A0A915PJA8_9BILA
MCIHKENIRHVFIKPLSFQTTPLILHAVERICWDPEDGELYLSRMKPEEIRSDSDVQIDRLTLV